MEVLKLLRAKYNMSQKALARDLGISQQALANYEAGKREPDNDMLIKMADYFGVSLDELLGREMIQEPEEPIDDFTYALYNEAKELTEEDKQQLINMARFLKSQKENR